MDLISRQAALDAINHICPVDTEYDCTLLDRVDVRCVLSELPTAVIMCKDCKYGKQDEEGWWYCTNFDNCTVGNDDGSGFCADAERKKNDG